MKYLFIATCFLLVALTACDDDENSSGEESGIENMDGVREMELTTTAFSQGKSIPEKHTCDGDNVSPALSFGEVPAKAQTLAIIMDDPDAPNKTYVHWVLWGIPGDSKGIEGGITDEKNPADGIFQGTMSGNKIGYRGPCPPEGQEHRYFFKLYALDTRLDLDSETTKENLLDAMEDHIIGYAELMGRYKRQEK